MVLIFSYLRLSDMIEVSAVCQKTILLLEKINCLLANLKNLENYLRKEFFWLVLWRLWSHLFRCERLIPCVCRGILIKNQNINRYVWSKFDIEISEYYHQLFRQNKIVSPSSSLKNVYWCAVINYLQNFGKLCFCNTVFWFWNVSLILLFKKYFKGSFLLSVNSCVRFFFLILILIL